MKFKLSLSLCIILLMSSIQVRAGLIVPADLNPGDVYHVIFISSTKRDADSSNIADYDTHVTNAAIAAGLGSETWLALVSTTTVNVKDHIDGLWTDLNAEPIYNQVGTRIADSFNDLWSGSLLAPIAADENGNVFTFNRSWTGFLEDGTTSLPLGNFPSSTFLGDGATSTDFGWARKGSANSGIGGPPNNLYGISSAVTVAPVPIPAAVWLMGSALVGLFGFKRKAA